MEKVRPWCGQPSYQGQLKNSTECFYAFATQHCRRRHNVFGHSANFFCHDISWTVWAILMKVIVNILQPLLMTWLDSGGERSSHCRPLRCWRYPCRCQSESIFRLMISCGSSMGELAMSLPSRVQLWIKKGWRGQWMFSLIWVTIVIRVTLLWFALLHSV